MLLSWIKIVKPKNNNFNINRQIIIKQIIQTFPPVLSAQKAKASEGCAEGQQVSASWKPRQQFQAKSSKN